ncbi:Eugenol synthase 1 [Acorus calamus]|uniref:Eugenol synthase 1 n=1 Tax=Acorus calamus TaxID=4465 RepID=A0AAV9FFC7_ACOCL|nr:Eugenol synthase 1 [Acorus calamus]KAK1326093.1 Eugenol synthase 1 [Acorus calamus]
MAGSASRILVVGGTGYLGRRLVRASVSMGHPTFVLLRPETLASPDPSRRELIEEFESTGVNILQSDLNDHGNLVRCMKLVDVVISALSADLHLEQHKIIKAIKEAGNIKRFLPSEFGFNVDRVTVLPPCNFVMDIKVQIRRAIEEAEIPHTYVASNCMAEYFIDIFLHPHEETKDEVIVYGTGKVKGIMNLEEDVAAYTIRTVDDPRTVNQVVVCQPPNNIITQLELTELWEKKTRKTFKKIHIPEEEMIRLIETLSEPENIGIAIIHRMFVDKRPIYELGENELEASELYPDYKYTSIDLVMEKVMSDPPQIKYTSFPNPSGERSSVTNGNLLVLN